MNCVRKAVKLSVGQDNLECPGRFKQGLELAGRDDFGMESTSGCCSS